MVVLENGTTMIKLHGEEERCPSGHNPGVYRLPGAELYD